METLVSSEALKKGRIPSKNLMAHGYKLDANHHGVGCDVTGALQTIGKKVIMVSQPPQTSQQQKGTEETIKGPMGEANANQGNDTPIHGDHLQDPKDDDIYFKEEELYGEERLVTPPFTECLPLEVLKPNHRTY